MTLSALKWQRAEFLLYIIIYVLVPTLVSEMPIMQKRVSGVIEIVVTLSVSTLKTESKEAKMSKKETSKTRQHWKL